MIQEYHKAMEGKNTRCASSFLIARIFREEENKDKDDQTDVSSSVTPSDVPEGTPYVKTAIDPGKPSWTDPIEVPTEEPTPKLTEEPTVMATFTTMPSSMPDVVVKSDIWHSPTGWIFAAVLFVMWVSLAIALQLNKHGGDKNSKTKKSASGLLREASMQNIGKRASQQDNYCIFALNNGCMAVVADGMGGLANGDTVSKAIVQCVENDCAGRDARQVHEKLVQVIAHANDEVNRMLGGDGLYKSGSTLIAAVAEPDRFSWISVGDSRIYLYRSGALVQLNREHVYDADLMLMAANHEIEFSEAVTHPKRSGLTSFIGMGKLKHIDRTRTPIRAVVGDRLLLCSDGVFNTLSTTEIEQVLQKNSDVTVAAEKLEQAVLAKNNPHQDNLTAIIIGFEA